MPMRRNNTHRALRQKQRGAVFIVSLVILLVVTMLAISSMQSTALEERMAGNTNDRNLAFQSTESALREAEVFIESITSLGNFNGTGGLIGRTDAEPSLYDQSTWGPEGNHVVAGTDFGSYEAPRYFIKNFTTVTGTEGALNLSGYGDNKGTGDVTVFRLTARGIGAGADSAEVILRSQYGRIF
ncbi:MAG: PilX N-terminal domain-containing pilus assembly protein [Pseudomonadota bacterium]